MKRRLYHYTSAVYHLPKILGDGFLKPVESNITMDGTGGPDVVWLTDEDDLQSRAPGWNRHGLVDKTEVRFTVETEAAIPWRRFARLYNMDQRWYDALNVAGSGAAKHWYVVPRPIPLDGGEVTNVAFKAEVYLALNAREWALA